MRSACLSLLVASALVSQEAPPVPASRPLPAPTIPFAPALYTLRATSRIGSSLVLLDPSGKETVIDSDPRLEGRPGLFGGLRYATHFGPFGMSPGGDCVVYTRFGKPAPPRATGGGFAMSGMPVAVGISTTESFGKRELEGIYTWHRSTGKPELICSRNDYKTLMKAWLKTPEGRPFDGDINFQKDMEWNIPMYLFHLNEERFLLVTHQAAIQIDAATKQLKPLRVHQAITDSRAMFTAWQEPDGSVRLFQLSMLATIRPDGRVSKSLVPDGPSAVFLPAGRIAISKRDGVTVAEPREDQAALYLGDPTTTSVDRVIGSRDGKTVFLYDHHSVGKDTLRRVDYLGHVQWTTSLGKCRRGLLVLEGKDRIQVFVRQYDFEDPIHRFTLDPVTGATLMDQPWIPEPKDAPSKAGRFAVPMELEDLAALVPLANGWLAWIPSHGELDRSGSEGSWDGPFRGTPVPIGSDPKKGEVLGAWFFLDQEGWMHPLGGRALVDQIVVSAGAHPLPFSTWANQGLSSPLRTPNLFSQTGAKTPGPYVSLPTLGMKQSDGLAFLSDLLQHPADPAMNQAATQP